MGGIWRHGRDARRGPRAPPLPDRCGTTPAFHRCERARLVIGVAAVDDRDRLLKHLVGHGVDVALPPMRAVFASVFTLTCFLAFVTNSNVTSPVGTPQPGKSGIIWAVRRTDIDLFFLKTGTETGRI
jgi:hypothetical protein